MAAVGGVFGARGRSGSKLNTVYDAEGNEIEVETREDEEQGVKLAQTVDLLLAAGYFRARIKGLSPFDKVVGGMTWCITTCNFDIDVDLLFQENSTIGQKIALTEKIVAVLPRMKCPHRIEPHQIQGLDFIHIYPVVQWLVKRAVETRQEMGDSIRQYAVSQFDKNHKMPEDEAFLEVKDKAIKTVAEVKNVYRPQRKYKRHDSASMEDEENRVHSTLLEYGRRYGLSKSTKEEKEEGDAAQKAAGGRPGSTAEDERSEEEIREEEERRIESLMSGMSAMGVQEAKLTASAVGSIVGMQSDKIQQIASEYADKQVEIGELVGSERVGGAQQHKRLTTSLNKQVEQQRTRLQEIQAEHDELHTSYTAAKEQLTRAEEEAAQLDDNVEELTAMESEANQGVLQTLRDLVAMNEKLRKQEQQFRSHCKEEMSRLQASIEALKQEGGTGPETEDQERAALIERQYEADREKLHKIRLLLARKNREISGLQRKIDEVPSRAELSQYQRRFIELYNQVSAKHKETKQFYTLYNTLDDTKLYLNKEASLLNSIHDNFEKAMASAVGKEQFMKQFESITEGIKQNRTKLEKKKQTEKMRRDQLNDEYLDLIEKQRLYFKTVKDFKEECRKNEILLAKLKATGAA